MIMGSCYERRVLMVLGPFIHLDALNMDMYTSVIQHLLDRQHPSAYPSSGSFLRQRICPNHLERQKTASSAL